MMFNWPLLDYRVISSDFGTRIHPVTGAKQFHNGVDIPCPEGTPVLAPCDGTVLSVWLDEKFGGGLSLSLEVHRKGVDRFGFAHLSKVCVAKGDKVRRGQVVAYSGGLPGLPESGKSTGPHLHMTVKCDGLALDPSDLLWV